MDPEATSTTVTDVVVELLCITAVISNPIKKAVNGSDVAATRVSATLLPRCCKDETINSIANMKSNSNPRIGSVFRTVFQGLLADCAEADSNLQMLTE